ncbi:hypothetical protein BT96DRAFT_1015205 [Gymnopus androsaceus JB14]|uniref:Glu-AdT subunit F n=1 Tax=Gymnopus androsaceus JB14 TaxID=1447944 RepID=A0A6A4IAX6_9AGAR|nr:hypothetical protein BT96DRAFT_1015205 [Gymnopus androsaceus JB14]
MLTSFLRRVPRRIPTIPHSRTLKSTPKINSDSFGLPTKPIWSVNELLSSYPKPELSASTFKRLHELSALIPPEEGTPEYEKLKRELEELVRLVEAVKLVDTQGVQPAELRPIFVEGVEEGEKEDFEEDKDAGRTLLKHASRTNDDFYVVEADRKR